MTPFEATQLLRKHNGELEDDTDTLLGSLRPYNGISKTHFSEIVKALYFAAPLLNSGQVESVLVHTIWDLTRSARLWTTGPREPMFHGREFISVEDKKTLDRWIYEIESITLFLLRGFEDWEVINRLAEEINLYDSIVDPDWLVQPFMKSLEYFLDMENHGGYGDDAECLCEALSKIGKDALPALPIIERVASQSKYPDTRARAEAAARFFKQQWWPV